MFPQATTSAKSAARPVAALKPVQVDSHHLEGADKTRLVVNLAHKALGCVSIFVELQKRLDDANLLSPTGKTSEIPFRLPRVAPESIERTNGRLVVYAPESLRINPGKQLGLAQRVAGRSVGRRKRDAGEPTSRGTSCFIFRLHQRAGRAHAAGRSAANPMSPWGNCSWPKSIRAW